MPSKPKQSSDSKEASAASSKPRRPRSVTPAGNIGSDLASAPPVAKRTGWSTKRRPQVIYARIIEAAIAAFTRDGFKGARLRSIAVDAGITIQLLVYHVKTKDRLWRLVMEHMKAQYEEHLTATKALPPTATATERLRTLIGELVRYSADNPQLHRIMTQEGSQMSPRLLWLSENFSKIAYDQFTTLVAKAQQEGSVNPDIEPHLLRFAVVGMAALPFSVSAEYEYFTGRTPFSPGEIERTIRMIHHLLFKEA